MPRLPAIDAVDFALVLSPAIALSATYALSRLIHRVPVGAHEVCAACRYALSGLPKDSPCPECGGRERTSRTLRWKPFSRADVLFVIAGAATFLSLAALVQPAAYFVTRQAIIADGFQPTSAARAAAYRVRANAEDPVLALVIAAAYSPLLALSRRRRARWGALVFLALLAFLGAVLTASEP